LAAPGVALAAWSAMSPLRPVTGPPPACRRSLRRRRMPSSRVQAFSPVAPGLARWPRAVLPPSPKASAGQVRLRLGRRRRASALNATDALTRHSPSGAAAVRRRSVAGRPLPLLRMLARRLFRAGLGVTLLACLGEASARRRAVLSFSRSPSSRLRPASRTARRWRACRSPPPGGSESEAVSGRARLLSFPVPYVGRRAVGCAPDTP